MDIVTKKGVIHKKYLKDRAIRPRHNRGVDYGADRAVLVRKGNRELQWRFACKSWTGILGGYQPEPAQLALVVLEGNPPTKEKILHDDGGRLSKGLIMCFEKRIDEFFGEETACFVQPQMTLLLGESKKDRK